MKMRVDYEMTADDLSALLDSMKPVAMIMLQCEVKKVCSVELVAPFVFRQTVISCFRSSKNPYRET